MIKEHIFETSQEADDFIVKGDRIHRSTMVVEVNCSSKFFPKVRWVVIEEFPEGGVRYGPGNTVAQADWIRITPELYEALRALSRRGS